MKECFSLHLYQSYYCIQDYEYEEKNVGFMIRYVINLFIEYLAKKASWSFFIIWKWFMDD